MKFEVSVFNMHHMLHNIPFVTIIALTYKLTTLLVLWLAFKAAVANHSDLTDH
jgi:hypothetical protein